MNQGTKEQDRETIKPLPFRRHPWAIAWDKWKASKEGRMCATGSASGVYLENRLRDAFMAGAKAGGKSHD